MRILTKVILTGVVFFFFFELHVSGLGNANSSQGIFSPSSDSVVNIGTRRELFVDDQLILKMKNLEFRMHPPICRETVMFYDRPGCYCDDHGCIVLSVRIAYPLWKGCLDCNTIDLSLLSFGTKILF